MSRADRLKEYANPRRRENWDGESCDKANLDRWSDRAEANSKVALRARCGEIKLCDTGGDVSLHDTEAKPRRDAGVDARMSAKADSNTDGGSSYMRGIRRNA
ncbi:hypothetical protein [Bradyrhizobium guangzhouense]|uniref:hypothetical protein n=1 Tax=Bradyrhizobium guangzhouense TaxID=1325095 RepID=UPI001009A6A8|nr:hypothetical protein [Bradyrhizobium guangzhouense]RXH15224.1 hypothetical protein EAS54_19300 [Bradyrhizobium guangzhouense]